MKYFSFFILLILTSLIFVKNQQNNTTSESNNTKKEKEPESEDNEEMEDNFKPNEKIFKLNDLTFDIVINSGKDHKWFLILYSETCGHCRMARENINLILNEIQSNKTNISTIYTKNLYFAEIEVNNSPYTSARFNLTGVPYIILIQNNSIYELNLYPNEKNLRDFIQTDFSKVKDDLFPFPPRMSLLKFAWQFIEQAFMGITMQINEIFYLNDLAFVFTPITLLLTIIMIMVIIGILEYYCCVKCCVEKTKKDESKEKNKEINKEKNKEENKDKNNENKGNDNINNDNIDNENNKDLNEDEKIRRENEKEKEEKMKEIEKHKQNTRKEKKKKKE